MFSQWRTISIVEIAFYFLLIIFSVIPAFKIFFSKSKFKRFYIRYSLLVFSKVVSGCLLVAYIEQLNNYASGKSQNEGDINLLVAALVLTSISFGFINILTNFVISYTDEFYLPPKEKVKGIVKVLEMVIPISALIELSKGNYILASEFFVSNLTFYALILNIVGATRMGDTGVASRTTTKQIMEASSILFAIIIVLNGLFAARKIYHQRSPYFTRILWTSLFISPLLLVRIIYSIGAAFTFNVDGTFTENTSKFTFLFGDWRLFLGLSFVEEFICTVLLCVTSWIVYIGEPKEKDFEYSEYSAYSKEFNESA
ncbi:hypothetical protein WICMUC_002505 [Wickerhamomyces mucosus]|uniref:DUF7702 domain-containing protein n=1 Tax=Wickerhamomyces mucosus TaxID=1378264 RepID=A0A9P8PP53_9ASCO|nr:hypothetical protein WICMUC_002505 [Wickerhamomyces mucosus]